MSKFICPFCQRQYNRSKLLYWCTDCKKEVKRSVFSRKRIKCKNKDENNQQCGKMVSTRKCPRCNEIIPKELLETKNLPFSIIGASSSGKTNYITVMLHELGRFSKLNLALGHGTKETREHQNNNYKKIYEKHELPDATKEEIKPQIWWIKNNKKRRGNKTPTYTFTIFDGAGESHEHKLDSSSPECQYIKASNAILLIIDPLTLSEIRHKKIVDVETMKNSLRGVEGETKNSKDILVSLANYIKDARDIDTDEKIKIPIAVVLTKFDTVLSHPKFGPVIKQDSLTVSNGKIDTYEIKQIDSEIKGWLEEIGEGQFIETLDSNFKNYCFFGVSSYGFSPNDAVSTPTEIKPHRVLDPILWLFKMFKFID